MVVAGLTLLVLVGLYTLAATTRPVRQAVRAYTELMSAVNRQDLEAVRSLCSERYLRAHQPEPADEGGVVGLPRNIHKNFRAWRAGPNVWICPTNRIGPVYQLVPEGGGWRFDGPVGLLRPDGQVLPMDDQGPAGSEAGSV